MHLFIRTILAAVALGCGAQLLAQSTSAARTLSGRVSNAATGALLEGARVEIQGTGQTTFTDAEGRYVLTTNAADATLVVSYAGLERALVAAPATGGATSTH